MDLLCFPNAALLALPNDELLAVTRSTPTRYGGTACLLRWIILDSALHGGEAAL
jgi:hypothetical protein